MTYLNQSTSILNILEYKNDIRLNQHTQLTIKNIIYNY